MIYAIQVGENGPIKIGVAKNPHWRVKELQTAQPEVLRVIATMDLPNACERDIHADLAEFHIRGEWFRPDRQVFLALETLKAMGVLGAEYQDLDLRPQCAMSLSYGIWWSDPEDVAPQPTGQGAEIAGFYKSDCCGAEAAWVVDCGDGQLEIGMLGGAPEPGVTAYYLYGRAMRKLEET